MSSLHSKQKPTEVGFCYYKGSMKIVLPIIILLLLSACTATNLIEIRQAMYRLENKKFHEQSVKPSPSEVPITSEADDTLVEAPPPTS